jgi:tetratricopeptide (TPR) repeat protein
MPDMRVAATVKSAVGVAAVKVLSLIPASAKDFVACTSASGDAAIAACTRAIDSGRFDDDVLSSFHTIRGAAYSLKDDHERAIADYSEAIRLDADDADIFLLRGRVRRLIGDDINAIADFSEAIRLDPDYASAFHERGIARSRMGDYENAIADFSEAIKLDPTNRDLYHLRGNAWQAKGDMDRARADRSEAMRLMMQL